MNSSIRRALPFVLLLAALGGMALIQTGGNLLVGTTSWQSAVLIPSPNWGSGGVNDQQCNVTNTATTANTNQQVAITCYGVPDANGHWNAVVRLQGFGGNAHPNVFGGYEFGAEGVTVNGVETVNRMFIWDNLQQRTIFERDMSAPDSLIIGQTDKPMGTWVTGPMQTLQYVQSPTYYSSAWNAGITASNYKCQKFENGLCVQ